jgi:adenosine deaminase/aminodeoxyfutalosine deaminase
VPLLDSASSLPVPTWIEQLPKAELHLHLEGAATAETLARLARRTGRTPAELDDIRGRLAYSDFLGFLVAFKYVSEQLRTPEDYAFLLRELLSRLQPQNVLYAEITLAAGVVLWKRQDLDAVFTALRQAVETTQKSYPIAVRWIFDAVRNFGPEHVDRVADCALRWKDAGVVGFGVGGDEQRGPAELFRATFDRVRAAGLHVTVHAGETAGPDSIWAAIRSLGAERIGHGLAAFLDAKLIEHLRQAKIPLEVCLSSNQRTGALRQHTGSDELENHPVVGYQRQGLRVTLSTDDPGLFDTTLNREYALAHRLGLTRTELASISEQAFSSAFCEPSLKKELLARVCAQLAPPPA